MAVRCSTCGHELEDAADRASPSPCPECRGTERTFDESVHEHLEVRDGLSFKHKRPGSGVKDSVIAEGKNIYASSKLARLVKVERFMDRLNDRYSERVTDVDTGEVIHQSDEPLSAHQEHGSAKKPKPRP